MPSRGTLYSIIDLVCLTQDSLGGVVRDIPPPSCDRCESLTQDSSKGGAVETGCRDLYDVIN